MLKLAALRGVRWRQGVERAVETMSWSSVLGRVRPQALWFSLARPGCAGRGLGAAIGGGSGSRQGGPWDVLGQGQQQQQCRGMASGNHRHKKILKMAKG